MKIYVGNMSFDTTEDQIRQAFESYGEVTSVNIITDRDTGRAKGFGFVEMSDDTEAKAAIAGLDSKELDGRAMKISEARPRPDSGNRNNRRY